MMNATVSACLLPVLVGACAGSGADYTSILDGPATVAFQSNLSESYLSSCRALARDQRQFYRETAGAAVLGAGAGALPGAADDDADAAGGAIAGALAGGVAGAVNASARREAIVVECLRGRGHRVVG
jgi:hypothetical protein